MNKRLAIELLQKVNNPSHMFTEMEADEDGVSLDVYVQLLANNKTMFFSQFQMYLKELHPD